MRLTVVQRSMTGWFISGLLEARLRNSERRGVTSPLVIKAPSGRENCHAAEFRVRTHRAPPSMEPRGRIGPRPTDAAGLQRAPPSRSALYASGTAGSYAAGDVAGERGVPAADRHQSHRMAESRALPRSGGADDATDPGGVCPQPPAPETWWRGASRES